MPGSFQQVLTKMRWAEHHLASLKLAIADYKDLEPYVAFIEDQPESQTWSIKARLRYPPPATIAHIVGDALNNLHGVLDHLSWQLALREDKRPNGSSSFPITTSLDKDGGNSRVNVFRERGKNPVGLINDEAVLGILQNVQPYNNGDDADTHPLEVLRALNGKTKHRYLPLTAGVAKPPLHHRFGNLGLNIRGNSIQITDARHYFQDGQGFEAIPYAALGKGELPKKPKLTTDVTLEEYTRHPDSGEPLGVLRVLLSIHSVIQNRVLRPVSRLDWPD